MNQPEKINSFPVYLVVLFLTGGVLAVIMLGIFFFCLWLGKIDSTYGFFLAIGVFSVTCVYILFFLFTSKEEAFGAAIFSATGSATVFSAIATTEFTAIFGAVLASIGFIADLSFNIRYQTESVLKKAIRGCCLLVIAFIFFFPMYLTVR